MASSLHSKLVAALLAPALLVASGAQGRFFMHCAEQGGMSMSCCCPGEKAPPAESTLTATNDLCCDTLAVPPASAQVQPVAVSAAPAPVLVAVAVSPHPALAVPCVAREAPSLDPPQSASIVLSNCALLI